MDLGSHSWIYSIVLLHADCFLNGCFSDTVFVTLFRAGVETAVSGVHKLLRTDGVPTSLTVLLFRRWLRVSSVGLCGPRVIG